MHRSTVEGPGGGTLDRAGHDTRRRPARTAVLALALLAGVALTACRSEPAATSVDPDGYARSLAELVDAERVAAGLEPLATSTCAQGHAADRAAALAAEDGPLEHAPLDAVTDDCVPASMSGENLSRTASDPTVDVAASSATDPADVVAAWMASPGHRSNILAAGFTRSGVACVLDPSDALVCSQVFLGP